MNQRLWIVIPAFNEAKHIAQVLKQVIKYTDRLIVVDDGSSDQTAQIASNYTPYVITHGINLGKGSALKTGCEYAFEIKNAQAVILLDGDAQHDPKEIPLIIKKLAANQIVLGARTLVSAMPVMRKWGNQFLSRVIQLLFGVYIPDILSGYKGFTRSAYQNLKWYSRHYGVEVELAIRIARYKMPFAVIPIKTIYHNYDRGMTILDVLELIIQIITWRLFI